MRQPHTLKISEIFPSIQGEGLRQGEATLFVRLSGCNLKCDFCDTKYAWKTGKEMAISRIMSDVRAIHSTFPAEWICLTGGEPLLQPIEGLIAALKTEGFRVQIETNATLFRRLDADWFTISPKPPDYFFRPAYTKIAKEVKIVVTKGLTFDTLLRLRNAFPAKIPLLLQPQSNTRWSGDLALKLIRQALMEGLQNIRVTAQLHKFFHWR